VTGFEFLHHISLGEYTVFGWWREN